MRPMNSDDLRALLAQHIGTGAWYREPRLPELKFTDGVKCFLESTGAAEVLVCAATEGLRLLPKHYFISLVFTKEDGPGTHMLIRDGNENPLVDRRLSIEGMPTGRGEFWLEDSTLYLPSEH